MSQTTKWQNLSSNDLTNQTTRTCKLPRKKKRNSIPHKNWIGSLIYLSPFDWHSRTVVFQLFLMCWRGFTASPILRKQVKNVPQFKWLRQGPTSISLLWCWPLCDHSVLQAVALIRGGRKTVLENWWKTDKWHCYGKSFSACVCAIEQL